MNNINVRSGFEWKNNFYTVRFIYNLHAEKLASLVANANSASYVTTSGKQNKSHAGPD